LPPDAPEVALPSVRVAHPYLAFVAAVELLHPPPPRRAPCVDPRAVIAAGARLGPGAVVGPHVVIGERTTIGRDATLHPNVTIYEDVAIGDGFTAHAGVVVREGTRIGDRVVLHAGAVIGSDGFGYLPLPEGIRKIPQIGTVVLEDEVEVGANATVDRAALGATVVGRGTKIDNLVIVGHGCRIGPECLLAAQVGLSGSSTLGARVLLGGQVGLAGHQTVGDRAQVAAKSGVHGLTARLDRGVHDYRVPRGLDVRVEFYRAGLDVFFNGSLHGEVVGTCARCLEEYAFGLDHPFVFVLEPRAAAPSESARLSSDDLALSYYEGDEIDLTPLVHEQIILALPTPPLCGDACRGP